MRYVEIRTGTFKTILESKTIEYFYHGTSDTRLHEILKKGIVYEKSLVSTKRATPWEPTFNSYFTQNFIDAIYYANRHAAVTDGKDFIIVLVKLVMTQQDYGLDEDTVLIMFNEVFIELFNHYNITVDLDSIDLFDEFNKMSKNKILEIMSKVFCKNIDKRHKEAFETSCRNNFSIIRDYLNEYLKFTVKIQAGLRKVKTFTKNERKEINKKFKPFLLLIGKFLASYPIKKIPTRSIATDSPIGYKKSKRIVGILRIPIHIENGIKVPQEGKILYNFEHGGDTLLTLYNRNRDFIKTILANPERMRKLET